MVDVELTDADVDGVLANAAFEEAAAAVAAQTAIVLAVAAVTTHGAHGCHRHSATCPPQHKIQLNITSMNNDLNCRSSKRR